MYVLI